MNLDQLLQDFQADLTGANPGGAGGGANQVSGLERFAEGCGGPFEEAAGAGETRLWAEDEPGEERDKCGVRREEGGRVGGAAGGRGRGHHGAGAAGV